MRRVEKYSSEGARERRTRPVNPSWADLIAGQNSPPELGRPSSGSCEFALRPVLLSFEH